MHCDLNKENNGLEPVISTDTVERPQRKKFSQIFVGIESFFCSLGQTSQGQR